MHYFLSPRPCYAIHSIFLWFLYTNKQPGIKHGKCQSNFCIFLFLHFLKGDAEGFVFFSHQTCWREGRREGAIAFKCPLVFFHPLPYPSPIKGRGEIKKIFHFYLSLFKREIKMDFSIFIITSHNWCITFYRLASVMQYIQFFCDFYILISNRV